MQGIFIIKINPRSFMWNRLKFMYATWATDIFQDVYLFTHIVSLPPLYIAFGESLIQALVVTGEKFIADVKLLHRSISFQFSVQVNIWVVKRPLGPVLYGMQVFESCYSRWAQLLLTQSCQYDGVILECTTQKLGQGVLVCWLTAVVAHQAGGSCCQGQPQF